IGIDDIVEEVGRQPNYAAVLLPVDLLVPGSSLLDVSPHESADIDGSEIADIEGKEWLLTARIGRFVGSEMRYRVVVIGSIDEVDAGLARPPRILHDLFEDLARVELTRDRAGAGIVQLVLAPL